MNLPHSPFAHHESPCRVPGWLPRPPRSRVSETSASPLVTSLRGMPTLEPQAVGVTHVDSWENHRTKQGIVKLAAFDHRRGHHSPCFVSLSTLICSFSCTLFGGCHASFHNFPETVSVPVKGSARQLARYFGESRPDFDELRWSGGQNCANWMVITTYAQQLWLPGSDGSGHFSHADSV